MWIKLSIWVTYCCLTNYPQTCNNNTNLLFHDIFEGQEFRCSWNGWFWLGVPHEFAIKMLARLLSSESLTRTGRSTSRVAHSYGWQFNVGCWQETWVPYHLNLSIGLLWCPHDRVAGFPRVSNLRENKEVVVFFMTEPWNSHITSTVFYWSHRPTWYIAGHEYQKRIIREPSWRLTTTLSSTVFLFLFLFFLVIFLTVE